MSVFEVLEPPTTGRAINLWLLTIGLGTTFTFCYFIISSSPEPLLALLAGAFASVFSLPVLLVLPRGIVWALAGPTRAARRWRMLGFVPGLFALATGLCVLVFDVSDNDRATSYASIVLAFAAPYLLAALPATYALYAEWLNVPAPD